MKIIKNKTNEGRHMKNKSYSSIDALLADVQKDINQTLQNEVMDAVRDVELKHIKRDVLDAYTPTVYERRTDSGIEDPNNIVGTVKDNKLTVDNVTTFNDGYLTQNHGVGLAYMINEGGNSKHDYEYGFRSVEAPYAKPRPFIDNTIEELDKTEVIEDALAKGLKKYGIDLY